MPPPTIHWHTRDDKSNDDKKLRILTSTFSPATHSLTWCCWPPPPPRCPPWQLSTPTWTWPPCQAHLPQVWWVFCSNMGRAARSHMICAGNVRSTLHEKSAYPASLPTESHRRRVSFSPDIPNFGSPCFDPNFVRWPTMTVATLTSTQRRTLLRTENSTGCKM